MFKFIINPIINLVRVIEIRIRVGIKKLWNNELKFCIKWKCFINLKNRVAKIIGFEFRYQKSRFNLIALRF